MWQRLGWPGQLQAVHYDSKPGAKLRHTSGCRGRPMLGDPASNSYYEQWHKVHKVHRHQLAGGSKVIQPHFSFHSIVAAGSMVMMPVLQLVCSMMR